MVMQKQLNGLGALFCTTMLMAMTGAAIAASDGTFAETSTGTSDVTVNVDVKDTAKLSGLSDIILDYDLDDYQNGGSFITAGIMNFCIYTSSDNGFTITAVGLHDAEVTSSEHAVEYDDGSSTGYVAYTAFGFMQTGSNPLALVSGGDSESNTNDISDANCSGTGGTNASVSFDFKNDQATTSMHKVIEDNNLFGMNGVSLTDTLTITLEPNI